MKPTKKSAAAVCQKSPAMMQIASTASPVKRERACVPVQLIHTTLSHAQAR